jgi:hypothetical protein
VQLRDETDVEAGCFVGRVEHVVVSGKATHFLSLKEMLAFIERVLAEPRSEPL